jgi:hypothetical protein
MFPFSRCLKGSGDSSRRKGGGGKQSWARCAARVSIPYPDHIGGLPMTKRQPCDGICGLVRNCSLTGECHDFTPTPTTPRRRCGDLMALRKTPPPPTQSYGGDSFRGQDTPDDLQTGPDGGPTSDHDRDLRTGHDGPSSSGYFLTKKTTKKTSRRLGDPDDVHHRGACATLHMHRNGAVSRNKKAPPQGKICNITRHQICDIISDARGMFPSTRHDQ